MPHSQQNNQSIIPSDTRYYPTSAQRTTQNPGYLVQYTAGHHPTQNQVQHTSHPTQPEPAPEPEPLVLPLPPCRILIEEAGKKGLRFFGILVESKINRNGVHRDSAAFNEFFWKDAAAARAPNLILAGFVDERALHRYLTRRPAIFIVTVSVIENVPKQDIKKN